VGTVPGVFFKRPGWDAGDGIYATDIRPEVGTVETWPMDVRAVAQQSAQLTFTGVSGVPEQYRVVLIDDDRTRSVDLRKDPAYRFMPAAPVSHFRIVVGSEEGVRGVLENLLPKEYGLGNNFPNPFNPTTTIPVSIPRNSAVELKVYTILGEEVRTLYAGPIEAGRHWFVWDGRNEQGRSVSSGVYLIRLTADGGQRFVGKMLLMK
jgi:hypothetical protein